jgi:hypothetical protein
MFHSQLWLIAPILDNTSLVYLFLGNQIKGLEGQLLAQGYKPATFELEPKCSWAYPMAHASFSASREDEDGSPPS